MCIKCSKIFSLSRSLADQTRPELLAGAARTCLAPSLPFWLLPQCSLSISICHEDNFYANFLPCETGNNRENRIEAREWLHKAKLPTRERIRWWRKDTRILSEHENHFFPYICCTTATASKLISRIKTKMTHRIWLSDHSSFLNFLAVAELGRPFRPRHHRSFFSSLHSDLTPTLLSTTHTWPPSLSLVLMLTISLSTKGPGHAQTARILSQHFSFRSSFENVGKLETIVFSRARQCGAAPSLSQRWIAWSLMIDAKLFLAAAMSVLLVVGRLNICNWPRLIEQFNWTKI